MWKESIVADVGHSVCLARIVQLVDTTRLDYNDTTWSNVDVAIWNIIESHIGAVTANIILMGPVVSLLSKRARRYVMPATSHQKNVDPGSSSYALTSYSRPEIGFKKIDDNILGVSTPTIEKGSSQVEPSSSETARSEHHGIKVRTDLEQNYHLRT